LFNQPLIIFVTFTPFKRLYMDGIVRYCSHGEKSYIWLTIMTNIFIAALFLVTAAGCSQHHYTVSGETINLYLEESAAKNVLFACNLDDFEPREPIYVDGHWVVSLPSTAPFRYFYILDEIVYVPPCEMKEKDDFGSENCIFEPYM